MAPAGQRVSWRALGDRAERMLQRVGAGQQREETAWRGQGLDSHLPQPHQQAWVEAEDPNEPITANHGGSS